MAVIYLQHPVHGAKVAISEMEAENDIENGWEEFDPFERAEVKTDDAPVNQLQPRRRGRRPTESLQ